MAAARKKPPSDSLEHRLAPADLRWRCDPERFGFRTTDDIDECPIRIIGQDRAQEALRIGLTMRSEGYNIFVSGDVGSGRSTVVERMLDGLDRGQESPEDLVYVRDFQDPDQPRLLVFPAGDGRRFREAMDECLETLRRDLPSLFDADEYRRRRTQLVEETTGTQKSRLKEFEKQVQEQGFAVVQVQMGPLTRPTLVPIVAGNPVEMEQLEALVEQGQFQRDEFERLTERRKELGEEMGALGKALRNMDRELRRRVEELDRDLARSLVEEAVGDVADRFRIEGIESYADQVCEDILERLHRFRDGKESGEGDSAADNELPEENRYRINVVVDNSKTCGLPIIWEKAPTYRNLFGTIEKVRSESGEWLTDHTHIKAGSLLRANGGILVLDAMDVLVEPGVWSALKRSLRNRCLEIQSFDPLNIFSAVSLKPESVPIDVKVVMFGTRHIYALLHHHDEDFKKIFKVKAEFAMFTARSEEELENYVCFVYKKVNDDRLAAFHRDAVAAVIEHGVRLAGDQGKLTTRFTEIADLIRESAYWAQRAEARHVRESHVEKALEQRVYRVSMLEELLRDRIADGTVLIDVTGERVGQVNGLAVLDQGDHVFAQPSRITAATAMGRNGIIDIERRANLSGPIHTKGVLILAGFLRARFAQDKPLALTASVVFEQTYDGVDGDSASSAELYALLSSLSGVPLRQGVAVTGSVNQMGEIQPIGGVNRKIEGFFDVCRMIGLDGTQGVLIPARNQRHLMLRKDVVDAVRKHRFHVWAVASIEQGLRVLTGRDAGELDAQGKYPAPSIFAAVDLELRRLAEEVRRYGLADVDAMR